MWLSRSGGGYFCHLIVVVVVDPFLSRCGFHVAGTLEWEEFLSFLSLSPASLRLVITRLQSTLKRDLNVKYNKNVQSLFDALTTGSNIFEYTHLGKRRFVAPGCISVRG